MSHNPPFFQEQAFRNQFSQFENSTMFPAEQLEAWWVMGTSYINIDNNYPWKPAQLQLASDLMCAHLAASFSLINKGAPTGVVQSATEGSVSVSMTPPPVKSAFGWWLSTTPYGMQLRALLHAVANVGLYVGGRPESFAFRKVGGSF